VLIIIVIASVDDENELKSSLCKSLLTASASTFTSVRAESLKALGSLVQHSSLTNDQVKL
jgi:hypothetical protein